MGESASEAKRTVFLFEDVAYADEVEDAVVLHELVEALLFEAFSFGSFVL